MEVEYAVWIMPSHDVYKKFRKIIRTLSKENKTFDFKPHITLISVKNIGGKKAVEKTKKILESAKPFPIKLGKIGYRDKFYQCIFVHVKKSKYLTNLNKKAQEIFGTQKYYMPHLSLMYGDFPVSLKEKIIKKTGRNFDTRFIVKNVYLIRSEGPDPKNCSIAKKFELV